MKLTTRITAEQFKSISAELALDLEAVYFIIQAEILNLLNEAEKEDWSQERIMNEIDSLLGDTSGS